jgi:hypothetical protein
MEASASPRESGVAVFPNDVPCDSNCPTYVYLTEKPSQEVTLKFTCVPVDDKGMAHPESATQKSLVTEPFALCTGDAGIPAGACTDVEVTQAGVACGAGNLVQSCTHSCVVGKGIAQCNLIRNDNKTDVCTQPFDQDGTHYANLAAYCSRSGSTGWQKCEVMGLKPSSADAGTYASHNEYLTPLGTATSTAGMIQSFKSSADRLIGKSNYSVETIVLDPSFDRLPSAFRPELRDQPAHPRQQQ